MDRKTWKDLVVTGRVMLVAPPGRGLTSLAQVAIRNTGVTYTAALVLDRRSDAVGYAKTPGCEAFVLRGGGNTLSQAKEQLLTNEKSMWVVDTIEGLMEPRASYTMRESLPEWYSFVSSIGDIPGILLYRYMYTADPTGAAEEIVRSFLGELSGESKELVTQIIKGSFRLPTLDPSVSRLWGTPGTVLCLEPHRAVLLTIW